MSAFAAIAAGAAEAGVIGRLQALCGAETWRAESIAEVLALPGVFAYLARPKCGPDDGPVGFVLCLAAADECELLSLGVVPDRRRRGVGRALLEAALTAAVAAGTRRMVLEVAEDNEPAKRLYVRCGFRIVGRRAEYYGGRGAPRRDAVIMARALGAAATEKLSPAHSKTG